MRFRKEFSILNLGFQQLYAGIALDKPTIFQIKEHLENCKKIKDASDKEKLIIARTEQLLERRVQELKIDMQKGTNLEVVEHGFTRDDKIFLRALRISTEDPEDPR